MKLTRWLSGPILTLVAAGVLEALRGTPLGIPNPPAVFVLTTVYGTFRDGRRAGLLSAAIAWLYLLYFFASPAGSFAYTAEDARRLAVWAAALPGVVLMIAALKGRADRAAAEIVRREREHSAELAASLTERRRAEESLRRLFERNLAGMFRTRRDGRILEANTALAHMLGFASRDQLLATNARQLYANPDDRERLLQLLQPGVVVSNYEVEWRRVDGRPIWVLINVREVAEGPSTYFEGIVLDITDRKRAEQSSSFARSA